MSSPSFAWSVKRDAKKVRFYWGSLKACPTGKCLAPKRHQTLFGDQLADVEVSGQTVKTCLIKHRSNYGYKPPSKRGTHTRAKHVWYGCPNKHNIAHQTREQKKCFILFDRMFDQISNFKHDQTRQYSYVRMAWDGSSFMHRQTWANVLLVSLIIRLCLKPSRCRIIYGTSSWHSLITLPSY